MHIAVLIAELYEDAELIYPYYRLLEAGHDVTLVGSKDTTYRGKRGTEMKAHRAVGDVAPDDFDGAVIPGGYSPDHMRRDPALVDLVREVGAGGKPVGAICHGPWMLASAGLAEARTLTSFFSIRDDLINAGATWVDEEVVTDGNIVTSRRPDDLPAFMRAYLTLMEEQESDA
jgi:protease I